MKNLIKIMAAAAAIASLPVQAAEAQSASVTTPAGVTTTVEFFTPRTARVTKTVNTATCQQSPSLVVVAEPQAVKVKTADTADAKTLTTAEMQVTIDKSAGTVTFADAKGNVLIAEDAPARFVLYKEGPDKGDYQVSQGFKLEADEPIYGLGNLENGRLSQRGEHRTLMPGNVEDGLTFFQSVKGYGVYWDNYSPTLFSDDNNVVSFNSEVGERVDYYVMVGGNSDGVIAEMRNISGQVPMFPLWTYGFWQSRERYKSQDELLAVLNQYRKDGVPIDGMIQDWQYWGNNYLWNAMEFMNPEFPRPQDMVDQVKAQNAHMIVSIWQSFGPETKPYKELDERGLLFNFSTWPQSGIAEQWPPRMDYPSGVRVYDAYSPEARDIYWNNLKRLYDLGIDGWWMDSTEPDHFDVTPEDMATQTHLGTFRKVRSAYPLMCVQGVYDHQRAVSDSTRVFILTRSGFAGSQRYGTNVWTGDVTSTWDNLHRQLGAMLNWSMTGNAQVNSDIGGFFAGSYNTDGAGSGARNPAYRELYTRWMQMGAFTPMMRSHGTEVPRELYYYGKAGEPIYDALVGAVKTRYSLLPYIYSTAWQVTNAQSSFMRPLPMDFAADRSVWNKNDAFMFGQSLLVAPVLKANYTPEFEKKTQTDEDGWAKGESDPSVRNLKNVDFTREVAHDVYLPKGAKWWDFWSNNSYDGGQTITIPTTIASIPVYVKAGGIVPIGPDVQWAEEKPWDNLTLRVFPGANGQFTLYEDEGDNYNYEQGVYTEIPMQWNDRSRTLTIGARTGSYPGMLQSRQFTVTLPDGTSKTVTYTGKKLSVKL